MEPSHLQPSVFDQPFFNREHGCYTETSNSLISKVTSCIDRHEAFSQLINHPSLYTLIERFSYRSGWNIGHIYTFNHVDVYIHSL